MASWGVSGRENVADYREISQAYAQGAIKGVVLINGGAAIAILAQAGCRGNDQPGTGRVAEGVGQEKRTCRP